MALVDEAMEPYATVPGVEYDSSLSLQSKEHKDRAAESGRGAMGTRPPTDMRKLGVHDSLAAQSMNFSRSFFDMSSHKARRSASESCAMESIVEWPACS